MKAVAGRAESGGVRPRSWKERYAAGKALREKCPRSSHAAWKAPSNRRDAVELVLEAEKGRLPDLLPLRHGRMVRSAFTFYRGAALTMAADLASTPSTGVRVQCCGDAHLCNFGGFATPERRVIFSINDLDETLPAPWEWDVKRLAASFVVAGRDNGLKDRATRDVARTCVRTYRESMAEFSRMKTLELWYQAIGIDEVVASIQDPELRKRALARLQKERAKSIAEDIFPKLAEHKGEMPVIKDQLPTIFHAEHSPPGEIHKAVLRHARRVPRHPAAGLPVRARPLRAAGRRDQGGGDRQRRDRLLGVPVHGRRGRPPVPPGQGGPRLGPRAVRGRERLPEQRRARRARLPADAARERHVPRVERGSRRGPPLLHPPAPGHQGQPPRGELRGPRDGPLRHLVRQGPRPLPRPLRVAPPRSAGTWARATPSTRPIAAFSMAYADQNEKDHDALESAVRKGKVKAVFEPVE